MNPYIEDKCVRFTIGVGSCGKGTADRSRYCEQHEKELLPVAASQEQGDNAERLPNDAYAAQGGKAAVNELLNLKMRQVINLREIIHQIRTDLDKYDGAIADNSGDEYEGFLEGVWWRLGIAEGERRIAAQILEKLNAFEDN